MMINVKGGMEPRHDCKIIVMGHLMAGKTTLILRVLLQPFDMTEIERTNGIIIIRKGAARLDRKKWVTTDNKEDKDEVLRRMETAESKDKTVIDKNDLSMADLDSALEVQETIQSIDRQPRKKEKERSLFHKLFRRNRGSQSDKETTCKLSFMDFAGQTVFNSTHQMFMSHRALYFLVFDVSRDLRSEVEDDDVYCLGANRRMTVEDTCNEVYSLIGDVPFTGPSADLTVFLMCSIHVYCGDHPDSYPKVLLIGTHGDKVKRVTAKQRMKRLKEKLTKPPLGKHLLDDFIVDCHRKDDPEVERLRQSIFAIAEKERHWGELTPTLWLPLENEIITRRENGERVLTLKTIREINEECFVKMESNDEIERFLRYHNELGNVIYFGGAAEDVLVILDPQWLIDALKQIITHKQFSKTPQGLEGDWMNFTESARLSKTLIETVWSLNKDKTFIEHMKQLVVILEKTDIIATPLTYTKDGTTDNSSYFFVPSMLKPNQDGKNIVEALLRLSQAKSPTLYFVFENNFMQPAVFPKLQAECTNIYEIKENQNKKLLFHQMAVFRLTQELDFVLEHAGHTIKITVINADKDYISPEICENLRDILEKALMDIVRLYGGCKIPFYKAVPCKDDSENLILWSKLEKHEKFICSAHDPDKYHHVCKGDVLGSWFACESVATCRKEKRLSKIGDIPETQHLAFIEIRRLARRLDASQLLLAARTKVEENEWQICRRNNKDDIVGEMFDTLNAWRKIKGSLTIRMIMKALEDSGSTITFEQLKEALADTDISKHLAYKEGNGYPSGAPYFISGFEEGFGQEFLETKVNDKTIDLLSRRSAKTHKWLALELGIEYHHIESVVKDNIGVARVAKILLQEWKRGFPVVTYREIFRAIIETDMDLSLLYECEDAVVRKGQDNA